MSVFCFGIKHFVFRAAGAAALLSTGFFALLLLFAFNAADFFFEFIAQVAAGEKPVGSLQARFLTPDFDAGGLMQQLDAGGGFVHLLSALAGPSDKLLRQVGLTDLQLVHPFLQFFPLLLCDHAQRKACPIASRNGKRTRFFKFQLAKEF